MAKKAGNRLPTFPLMALIFLLAASLIFNAYQTMVVIGLQGELIELAGKLADSSALVAELSEIIQGQSALISERSMLIEELSEKLSKAEKTIIALEYELNESYMDINSLKEQLRGANETIKTLYATFNFALTPSTYTLEARPAGNASVTLEVSWLGGPPQEVNLTAFVEDHKKISVEFLPASGTPDRGKPLESIMNVYVSPDIDVGVIRIEVVATAMYGSKKSVWISIRLAE
jgi:uncharacterized coiled-coil protein SlyX